MKKLHMGNSSWETTDPGLRRAAGWVRGVVEAGIITDRGDRE